MRIAISTDGSMVSAHFGRCPMFTIVDIADGSVVAKEVVRNPGHEPGRIPQFLGQHGVECIIAGGMGGRALQIFANQNIQVIVGVQGTVDDVLRELEAGTLRGGESLCQPGGGRGYGVDKESCDHEDGPHQH